MSTQQMETNKSDVETLIERLSSAMNSNDLSDILDCFHPEYHHENPAEPERSFDGKEAFAADWQHARSIIKDFRAEILGWAVQENTIWAEWHTYGYFSDGTRRDNRGVTILGLESGLIRWGREYFRETPQNSPTPASGK